ncbi:hypothetical protein GCM10009560_27590 [Nonomuraea longicatena]|uniref:Uncharacterized protein n=1 Tax=Nonomuraea longicatena TaxID=83682 RepID=A0ABN1PBT7_9ACTN
MAGKCPDCGTRFIQIDQGDDVPSHRPPGEPGTCSGSGNSADADTRSD